MSDEPEFGLVMPFVAVASVGGEYDDNAYAAGWEVGNLDARLRYERPAAVTVPVHVGNLEQVDLVAMLRGYAVTIAEPHEVPGWAMATLHRTPEDVGGA